VIVEQDKAYRSAEGQVRFVMSVSETTIVYRAKISGQVRTVARAEMEEWAVEEA
jgi:hypothetical protein